MVKAIKKQTKKQRPLTIKQRKFIDEVVKSWNATEASSKVYKTKNKVVAGAIWYENLRKPQIKAEIEDRVQFAKDTIYWLCRKSKKDEIKIRAAQDIIDRAEWKALARTQLSGELKVVTEDELIE